jgi:glucosamine-6-phosphate deaminase
MHTAISATPTELGQRAGHRAAALLRQTLDRGGQATLVVATGASQFATIDALVSAPGIAWDRVTAFHLDEYVGIPADHPASFRRYLRERFASRLPTLAAFHEVGGDAGDAEAECARLGGLLAGRMVDVGLIGIGENGHLAFNDPPADFTTTATYHVVALDDACRRQQVGEGWFPSLAAVPTTAISMTVPAIMRFTAIVCSVPDARKAAAVAAAVGGPLTPRCPASILRNHPDCTLFLDRASAAGLANGPKGVACAG